MARSFFRRRMFLQQLHEYPVLDREDEAALLQRVRNAPPGDPSHHELVMTNMAFVIKVALEYRWLDLPFDDLVHEGSLGVIEAARHFDPARGTRFLTYAVWWIRRSMLRALAREGSLIKIPGYQLNRLRSVAEAGRRLSKELGREADREEISREMQLTLGAIDDIMSLRSRELSLEEPVGQDRDTPISDGLADARSVNPERELLRHEQGELVRWALEALDEEERMVIVHRFGLEGGDGSTLQELGERMGVSRERIRQIEVRAKNRLRKAIAWQLRPYAAPRTPRGPARRVTVPA